MISSTRFVQSITVLTDSNIEDAIFLVKFYEKGVNGLPDVLLNKDKIIAIAKKGIHKTEIRVEDQYIYFPEGGLFVAIEFLIIDQNKVKRENPFTYEGKLFEYNYEPKFSTVEVDEHPFHYSKNIKTQLWTKISNSVGSNTLNYSLECEIILTE